MNPRRLKILHSFHLVHSSFSSPFSFSLSFCLFPSLSFPVCLADSRARVCSLSVYIASERAQKIKCRLETTKRNNGQEMENTVPFMPCLCALLSCSRHKTTRNACRIRHVDVRELIVHLVPLFPKFSDSVDFLIKGAFDFLHRLYTYLHRVRFRARRTANGKSTKDVG